MLRRLFSSPSSLVWCCGALVEISAFPTLCLAFRLWMINFDDLYEGRFKSQQVKKANTTISSQTHKARSCAITGSPLLQLETPAEATESHPFPESWPQKSGPPFSQFKSIDFEATDFSPWSSRLWAAQCCHLLTTLEKLPYLQAMGSPALKAPVNWSALSALGWAW